MPASRDRRSVSIYCLPLFSFLALFLLDQLGLPMLIPAWGPAPVFAGVGVYLEAVYSCLNLLLGFLHGSLCVDHLCYETIGDSPVNGQLLIVLLLHCLLV